MKTLDLGGFGFYLIALGFAFFSALIVTVFALVSSVRACLHRQPGHGLVFYWIHVGIALFIGVYADFFLAAEIYCLCSPVLGLVLWYHQRSGRAEEDVSVTAEKCFDQSNN